MEQGKTDKTVRMFEAPNAFWRSVYQNIFGSMALLIAILSWVLLIIWLEMDSLGGFGSRETILTTSYFNWHPLLMMTGFVLFMVPAAVSFELFPFVRSMNKNLHGLFNGLGVFSAFAGLAIIIDCHHNLSDYGDFVSVHSCIGLITLIIVGINYIGGFVMYVLKLGGKLRIVFKPMHKRLGLCGVILGVANCAVGIQEKCTKSSLDGSSLDLGIGIACLLWFVLIGIIFSVVKFMDKADGTVEYSPINANEQNVGNNYGSKPSDDQL